MCCEGFSLKKFTITCPILPVGLRKKFFLIVECPQWLIKNSYDLTNPENVLNRHLWLLWLCGGKYITCILVLHFPLGNWACSFVMCLIFQLWLSLDAKLCFGWLHSLTRQVNGSKMAYELCLYPIFERKILSASFITRMCTHELWLHFA